MLEEFVKLTTADYDRILYIRPHDIASMCYDPEYNQTIITTLHGTNIKQTTVEETPGVICALCDKALRNIAQKGRRS